MPMPRVTHTVVILDVTRATYDEIAAKFRAAGYDHVFDPDELTIYMDGIALVPSETTTGEPDERTSTD